MLVAIVQINSVIGNFKHNIEKILLMSERINLAFDQKIKEEKLKSKEKLIVFPELALCGYPPMDLLKQKDFLASSMQAIEELKKKVPKNLKIAVGTILPVSSKNGEGLYNAIVVIENARQIFSQAKTLLPSYDVFNEERYFEVASKWKIFHLAGKKIAFLICEDIWKEEKSPQLYKIDPVNKYTKDKIDLIVVPSASPFEKDKFEQRYIVAKNIAIKIGAPLAYCNSCGSNDGFVFDGRSFAVDKNGKLLTKLDWQEDYFIIPEDSKENEDISIVSNHLEDLEKAITIGISDFAKKCDFKKACLGLSGGIDSALVASLVTNAMGSENILGVLMPSRYSSEASVSDARDLAINLGIKYLTIPLENVFESTLNTLGPFFENRVADKTEENIQARLRGLYLMSLSNKFAYMVLATGNKSELATGYCTLYGDMCGALAPIGDLYKTQVYELSKYINRKKEIIPINTINKAPSAELRPDQKDADSLPEYNYLDSVLKYYLEENLSLQEIAKKGYDENKVRQIIQMTEAAEFKRRQGPIVIKLSQKAFGLGRRMPITKLIL